MSVFDMFTINFDFAATGASDWNFDNSQQFDSRANAQIVIDSEVGAEPDRLQYFASEAPELLIELIFQEAILASKFVDLLPLVPAKFRTSQLLVDYLREVGIEVGKWLSAIDDLLTLLDPYRVGDTFLEKLASQIGYVLVRDEETTTTELRRQVVQAIDWFKRRGTYESLDIIAFLSGLQVTLFDMYTNDYAVFVPTEWFVGDEGENPPEFDSSYYKSPHFGMQVDLNKVFGTDSDKYLWRENQFAKVQEHIERTRPVNTVPHFLLSAIANTDETGSAFEADGEILAAVTSNWIRTRLFFDQEAFGSGEGWAFDAGGETFDQTADSFIQATNKWKIGTGNKGVSPAETGFALETVVLSGTVDKITVLSDRIEFLMVITTNEKIIGLSELGLYDTSGNTLRLGVTFPDIDLEPGIELRMLVRVFFQDL